MNKKKKSIINQFINKIIDNDSNNNNNNENQNEIIDQNNKYINHNNKLNIEFILQISISIIILSISLLNNSNNNNNQNQNQIIIISASIINIIIQFYLHIKSNNSKINNKSIIQRPLVTDWGLSLSISLLPNVLLILLYNINKFNNININNGIEIKSDLVLFYLLSVAVISPLYLLNYLSLSSSNKDKSSPPLLSTSTTTSTTSTTLKNNKFIIYLISLIGSLIVLIISPETSSIYNIVPNHYNSNNKIINIIVLIVLLNIINSIYIFICKQLLEKLTASFTIGEASIISQIITILISESIRYIFNTTATTSAYNNSNNSNNNNNITTDNSNNNNNSTIYQFNNLNILYCFYSLILGSLLVVIINSLLGIASNLRKLVVSTKFTQSPLIETKTISKDNSATSSSSTITNKYITTKSKFTENKNIIVSSLKFYSLVIGIIFLIIYPVLSYQLGGQNPFEWVFQYIGSSKEIMWLMVIWSALLICTVVLYQPSIHSEIPMIISRKYFHILAIVMFTPPLLFFPSSGSWATLNNTSFQMNTFMVLSYAVSISALILLELLKYSMAPPLAEPIKLYMDRFLDSRDSGIITLTHLYLLLGCSIPLFITFFIDLLVVTVNNGIGSDIITTTATIKSYHLLSPFSGILTIGVGDTMASYFGVKYGRNKWFGSSHKSIEGTVAGSVFTILASLFIYYFSTTTTTITTITILKIIFASTICSVIEASTNQIDNLILPIFYFILINL